MQVTDIPIILEMEKKLFSSPWKKDMFLEEIKSGYAFVAQEKVGNTIAGYICGLLLYDEFNITNLAVSSSFQRQGLAELLVKFVIGRLLKIHCSNFFLEVRVSNLAAIALYRKLGFEIIGKRKKYYNKPQEDALMMQMDLLEKLNDENSMSS